MSYIVVDVEADIIKSYISGESNKSIANRVGIHRTTVQRILKRNLIQLRKHNITSRKKVLINFRGDIITNNDAYILGLIWSDGNLFRNNIEIVLQYKDKSLLENISKYVYNYVYLKYRDGRILNKNNKQYKTLPQWRFSITSKEVCDKLRKIGLKENKSIVCRMPIIESKFNSHFIRGVFDGDGCLFKSEKYKGTNRITIISNELFCNDLKSIIESEIGINVKINNKTNTVKLLSISGNNQISKFLDWIYMDSELRMDRKYNKYLEHFNKI